MAGGGYCILRQPAASRRAQDPRLESSTWEGQVVKAAILYVTVSLVKNLVWGYLLDVSGCAGDRQKRSGWSIGCLE